MGWHEDKRGMTMPSWTYPSLFDEFMAAAIVCTVTDDVYQNENIANVARSPPSL
jgi:hypothetical protein